MTRTPTAIALLAALSAGCAPELEGADQAYDANYSFVTSADQAFANVSYPAADTIVDDLLSEGATGCGYGLVADGDVFYVNGVGSWSVGSVAPIGSASKTLTALGLVRLMEEYPALSPGDSVQEHLPSAPWDVTIEELLTHTTGLDSWASFGAGPDLALYPGDHPMQEPRYAFAEYSPNESLTQAVGAIDGPTGLPTGSYSNVGYSVLGAVIDEIVSSGGFGVDGYEQWIWQEVARGGNLTNGSPTAALFHTWRVGDIPGLIPGYIGGVPAANWDVTGDAEGWEGPPGGWSMTIGDFARIVAAIQREAIVADGEWLEPKSAVEVFGGGGLERYGWGVVIEPLVGMKKYTHPGDNNAYGAQWATYNYDDGSSFGVAVVCNAQVGKGNTDNVILRLRNAYSDGDLVPEFGFGFQPVGVGAVNGRRYALDLSAIHTDIPGFGAPSAEIDTELSVSVSQSRNGLDLSLVGSNSAFRTVNWWGASFAKDPYVLTSTTATLRLPTRSGGDLVLEGASFAGAFGKSGDNLLDIEIDGTLDTRTLDRSWLGGRDACQEASLIGRSCEPCADGSRSCVPLTLLGLAGKAE